MGAMIRAHCDCSLPMTCSLVGENNFTTLCNFPYYCEECGILFVVNRFEKKICCPKGGKEKVIAYDDKKICNSKGNVAFSWDIATIHFL